MAMMMMPVVSRADIHGETKKAGFEADVKRVADMKRAGAFRPPPRVL
jgi:hypothetical protein